jgi:DNA topoisomerase-1
MEDDLDAIAAGRETALPWLKRFYFGSDAAKPNGNGRVVDEVEKLGLRTLVAERLNEIDARAINTLHLGRDADGQEILVRVGRYGPYLQRGDQTASLPEDLPPDEVTLEKAAELLAAPSGDRLLGSDPATEQPVYVRAGRFGAYVQLGEAGGKEKPRTASLLRSMLPATATLEDALKMLSLPRTVGVDASGTPITAQLGRYGPYISCGKESRSLEREEDVFELSLERANALLAEPKPRGRRAAKEPLKELGADGVSGGTITVREGRFGLYVTDGETNASLRNEDTLENITTERAQELLSGRRGRAPVKKKTRARKASASGASKQAKAKAPKAKQARKSEPAGAAEAAPVSSKADGAKAAKPAKPAPAAAAPAKDGVGVKRDGAQKKAAPKKAAANKAASAKATGSKATAAKAPSSKATATKATAAKAKPSAAPASKKGQNGAAAKAPKAAANDTRKAPAPSRG